MATRLYFPASNPAPGALTPSFAAWTTTAEAARHIMTTAKGVSAITAGTQIDLSNAAGSDALDRQWISPPLLGAQTIGGVGATFSGQLMVREWAGTDNVDRILVCIKVYSGDGTTLRGTVYALANGGTTTEFVNAASCRNHTFANAVSISSGVSAQDGDILVVEIGYETSAGGTSPQATAKWGENATDLPVNDTQTTDGAGWIEFSQNFTFKNIAFVAMGAVAEGTTSLSVAYPAGLAAGDLLVLAVASKYPSNAPTTPSGWTLQAQPSAGNGASGVDSGAVYMSVYTKEADGSETGNLSVTITSGNAAMGRMFCYRKPSTKAWDIADTEGSDTTVNATWSITGAGNPGIDANDLVLALSAINGDGITFSAQAVAATGTTWYSAIELQDSSSTQGDDLGLMCSEHKCFTGPASAAPTYTANASSFGANHPTGPTVLLRLRFVDGAVTPEIASAAFAGVNPTVTLGGLNVTPTIASSTFSGVAPTNTLTQTPTIAGATFSAVDPTVAVGGVNVTPTIAVAVFSGVAPSITLGGLNITPEIATAAFSGVAPLNAFSITPVVASAVFSAVNPTVDEGGGGSPQNVEPVIASAVFSAINPTVTLGGVNVTPTPAAAAFSGVAPSIALGGLNVEPAIATAAFSGVAPAVALGGLTIVVGPAASAFAGVAPSITLGGISVSPLVATATFSAVDAVIVLGTPITGVLSVVVGATAATATVGAGLASGPVGSGSTSAIVTGTTTDV